jgi:dienelactone hydrolase
MRPFVRICTALLFALLVADEGAAQDARLVPVTVDGEQVRLEMRIYAPATSGRLPTLVFNHGSTGRGLEPGRFTRPIDFPALAGFFRDRGWAVVMPARRGRGGSEGLYDEGFAAARAAGYTCDPARALRGADRALRDIEAAISAILAMPFVDRERVVIGGQSRGGILSVAYAGLHPEQVKGVLNFVGGWSGGSCSTTVNESLFVRGARYPEETLWLYAEGDPFYSLSHSQANFAAFRAAGGRGTFSELEVPPNPFGGHGLFAYPDVWASAVDAYLKRRGLP